MEFAVLLVSVWVFSRPSDFIPPSEDMQLHPKFSIGVNVSVNACLTPYISPVIGRRPVPAVLRLSPNDGSNWLQHPCDRCGGQKAEIADGRTIK